MDLPRPIGFVLGGGGSLGAIQVGMLRALAERDIMPDLVTGTSVGSLNGALIAQAGSPPIERLTDIWSRMTRQAVFPGTLLGQVRTFQRTKTHLFPSDGLAAVVSEHLGGGVAFEDLRLPLGVVAMDVATARPVLIRSGPVAPAVLASAAIPGIFSPVEHEGRVLYDGGVVANVPMRQAIAMGARSLVVLDCAFPGRLPEVPRGMAEIVLYMAMVSMRQQAVLEAPLVAAEVPVVYLPGPPLIRVTPLDFTHTPELIGESYVVSSAFLHGLTVSGPGLYGAPGRV
ncbi:patatin-like phospholipase family protein [Actinokineospora xionganensis]|uniref:Patatin-like phospholipase family protein n=1 Tax=Actinokineospora xionganensis TaxID=2684470 RepID=A0ABR7LBV7_9PSEU|nr:patatin-like phospholipase family protein [Actinokineospora xionganensis]MBC6449978.1 patatin-like phospholipase family protein [Actinokineospora xionganensis]